MTTSAKGSLSLQLRRMQTPWGFEMCPTACHWWYRSLRRSVCASCSSDRSGELEDGAKACLKHVQLQLRQSKSSYHGPHFWPAQGMSLL